MRQREFLKKVQQNHQRSGCDQCLACDSWRLGKANITPMMKAYLNETWASVGHGLCRDKEMRIVSTAVGGASTYGNSGRIGVELKDVFLPMKASALHCGMTYLEPLVFQEINKNDIPRYQESLIERLVN